MRDILKRILIELWALSDSRKDLKNHLFFYWGVLAAVRYYAAGVDVLSSIV